MKRALTALWTGLSSRALAPLVIGFFLLLYIGTAFFTEEALTVLIALTGRFLILGAVLSLLPINLACRIALEVRRYLLLRRARAGSAPLAEGVYDEVVDLEVVPAFAHLEQKLAAAGYRTRKGETMLSAWRGLSLAPARILWLAGVFCIFAGIFVSLESRRVQRQPVIEGEPFPAPSGAPGGMVQRIVYKLGTGAILAKNLEVEVANGQGGVRTLGVYPPALYQGAFAYPRYLGIALHYRFSAPDIAGTFESGGVFPIYPPGKETNLAIPGSPYKIVLSLARPEDGSDPYMTGNLVFPFKLLKEKDVLFTGSIPRGGAFARDGVRIEFPEARRMVVTDFVVDYGVLLIWGAGLLLAGAALVWLPVRYLFPRREMLFSARDGGVRACSHAEGGARSHAGVFHEMLDVLAAQHPAQAPARE